MPGIGDVFLNNIKSVTSAGQQMPSAGDGEQILASMKNGETFSAKVVRASGSDVTLRLSGGETVNARLSSNIAISEGQTVSFEVKNSGSSISISPLLTNTATDISVLKALEQASLPANNATVNMTSEMMKAGLSIDKNSLLAMYDSIRNHPSANISDIVDLSRLGLELNEDNLKNIDSYKNLSYQIDQGMQDLAARVGSALMDLVRSGDTDNAAKIMSSILSAAIEGYGEGSEGGNVTSVLQGYGTDASRVVIAEDAAAAGQAENTAAGSAPQDAASKALELLKAMQQGQDAAAAQGSDLSGVNSESALHTQGTLTAEEAMDRVISMYREITQDPDYKPDSVMTLLRDINSLAGNVLNRGTDALKELLSSDPLRKLAFDMLKDQWSISPSEVADKDKVESLYKRLTSQIRMIADGLTAGGLSGSPAFNAAENIRSNVDFLQQINQMYAYIQLPLKLSGGENAHGDLYVYSNRKNLASDSSVVTAFMHLDMEHLGPVDVYVSMDMSSGGRVSTAFTVADDETLDLIGSNIHLLNDRLAKRGYELNCSMKLKGEDDTPEEEALNDGGVNLLLLRSGNIGSSVTAGQRSFDVRA